MLKNQFKCARTGQEFLKGVVKQMKIAQQTIGNR